VVAIIAITLHYLALARAVLASIYISYIHPFGSFTLALRDDTLVYDYAHRELILLLSFAVGPPGQAW
jgi:hypothetical protein